MRSAITILLAVFPVLIACGGDEGSELEPTLSSIQENVFSSSCGFSGCHGAIQSAAGIDLSSVATSKESLIGIPSVTTSSDRLLVMPEGPDESYLLNKLRGLDIETNEEFPSAARMPAIGEPLAPEVVDTIELWIVDGCPL